MLPASREHWKACDMAIKRFTQAEQELLIKYYMTGYGDFSDLSLIQEYTEQNGMQPGDAWDIIKRANYEAAVERGLIDRTEGDSA